MRIGVDIDGTISNTWERWARFSKEHGLEFDANNISFADGIFTTVRGSSLEEVRKAVNAHPMIDREYKVYPGAPAILAILSHHEIFLVTGRGDFKEGLIHDTHWWLKNNKIMHDEVVFANSPLLAEGKLSAINKLALDVVIEDEPAFAISVANAGIPVLLHDQPYNKEALHPRIMRFSHWLEVPLLLKKIEEQ